MVNQQSAGDDAIATGPVYQFRPAEGKDAEQVAMLLADAFVPQAVPGWSREALEGFFADNAPGNLDVRFSTAVYQQICTLDGEIVGYVYCARADMITLLAVGRHHQGTGIGRALLGKAVEYILLKHPQVSVIQVNATERSQQFYQAAGFYPLSQMMTFQGSCFMRMGYWGGRRFLDGLGMQNRT